jgi:hypothetical protein
MTRNGQTPKQSQNKKLSQKESQKESAEQKAERERKREEFRAMQLAKYGDPLAAIRAANPKADVEVVTGSPYQSAREAWTGSWNGSE